MIELQNVSKVFTKDKHQVTALKNVSLTIEKGSIYGIIGFSGAGKSTLVRCINLLEKPTSGKVLIHGTDLMQLSEKELRTTRKNIGMIFQQFNLFQSRTVKENVAFALKGLTKKEQDERVGELLTLVGIADKENSYPSQLSGGQKQRVAIARALANRPEILLCDEATSALDPQTTAQILTLLQELNAKLGITIVIITHEMKVVKEICEYVAVMDSGAVVEAAKVAEVFSHPKADITKNFIDTTTNSAQVTALIAQDAEVVRVAVGEQLLRFNFLGNSAGSPLISELTLQYGVQANIIFGNIEVIQGTTIGHLIVILSGPEEKQEVALNYLRAQQVEVEVLQHA